ncbi:MAG TPA: hypothetical protein ENJ09_11860 [Planctomycetes bacterium]|nr:hypothetical protein [Planctomycetota bacterium]
MGIDTERIVRAVTEFLASPLGFSVMSVGVLLFALGWVRIFRRAGFRASTGVYMLVPGLNVALFLWLAFAPWPLRRKVHHLDKMQRRVDKAHRKHERAVEREAA